MYTPDRAMYVGSPLVAPFIWEEARTSIRVGGYHPAIKNEIDRIDQLTEKRASKVNGRLSMEDQKTFNRCASRISDVLNLPPSDAIWLLTQTKEIREKTRQENLQK